MSDQTSSVEERLSQAGDPRDRIDWKREEGTYIAACRLSPSDIPQLIDIACRWGNQDVDFLDTGIDVDDEFDDEFDDEHDEEAEDEFDAEAEDEFEAEPGDQAFLPINAWRALADLRSSECVEPLIGMLRSLDDVDGWPIEELPRVFGKIGEPSIGPLVDLANDVEQDFVRAIAATALGRVAEYHPVTRDRVVEHLKEMLGDPNEHDIDFNSNLMLALVELNAVEAAEVIERAFAANRVDTGMIGDWGAVRERLGVEGLGLEMPKHTFNSVEQFRIRMGIGIFSDKPLFRDDECPADLAETYYKRAWEAFSASEEAEQVRQSVGEVYWFLSLLKFGVHYLGEIVDSMTYGSVHEFLFDYAPRKVSTSSNTAAAMVLELTKFWEFLHRVYDLPKAESIVQWLKSEDLVEELQAELDNSDNYGPAKAFVMAGREAGYDMSSEAGMAEFLTVYNNRLLESRSEPGRIANSGGTIVSDQPHVGRNDPCPCGSGKKFKKCCLRRQ